jgi:hypothetical protein
VSDYVIDDWGGVEGNPLRFVCYEAEEMDALLLGAGFARTERFEVTSPVYARMPRLVERGVEAWQVVAHAPESPRPGEGEELCRAPE